MMDKGCFVTGTDTGIGKTLVSVAIIHALQQQGLQVAAMKPVASGGEQIAGKLVNADALALQAACSTHFDYELINPYVFEPAISPHLAAGQSGTRIDLDIISQACMSLAWQTDQVVIEGVGGWLAPLDDDGMTVADLASHLGLPVVLVVGMRLGCLNHALLSAAAITASGCTLGGWVANCIDPEMLLLERNIDYLARRLPAPLLGTVPWQKNTPQAARIEPLLDIKPLIS